VHVYDLEGAPRLSASLNSFLAERPIFQPANIALASSSIESLNGLCYKILSYLGATFLNNNCGSRAIRGAFWHWFNTGEPLVWD